jgi:hypothetical protein
VVTDLFLVPVRYRFLHWKHRICALQSMSPQSHFQRHCLFKKTYGRFPNKGAHFVNKAPSDRTSAAERSR